MLIKRGESAIITQLLNTFFLEIKAERPKHTVSYWEKHCVLKNCRNLEKRVYSLKEVVVVVVVVVVEAAAAPAPAPAPAPAAAVVVVVVQLLTN